MTDGSLAGRRAPGEKVLIILAIDFGRQGFLASGIALDRMQSRRGLADLVLGHARQKGDQVLGALKVMPRGPIERNPYVLDKIKRVELGTQMVRQPPAHRADDVRPVLQL